MKSRKSRKKSLLAWSLIVSMVIGLFSDFEYSEMKEVEAAKALENPRIVEDASMNSGQKVTWDCVWFGSYPQAEVVDSVEDYIAIKSEVLQDGDIIEDSSLYNKLKSCEQWDENGDVVINGERYHRIKQSDATNGFTDAAESGSRYIWSDDISYHYFKYEPIKWRILKVDSNQMFLLADIVLDCQCYLSHDDSGSSGIWKDSLLRTWLNSVFINNAFTENEKAAVMDTELENLPNSKYGKNDQHGKYYTTDQVFALSESEVSGESAKPYGFVSSYDIIDEARQCQKSSTYAKANGTSYNYYAKTQITSWLLRTMGWGRFEVMTVYPSGGLYHDGSDCWDSHNIRPALNLDITSGQWSEAGTVCSDGTVNEVAAPNKPSTDEPSPDEPEGDKSDYIGEANITYHFSASDGTRRENYFRYSDYMFYVNENTIHYNNDLAKASLAAVMAGFSDSGLNDKWTQQILADKENHYGRARNIAELYGNLKFSGAKYYDYDMPLNRSDDKVAFSIARKYINKAETIDDTSKGEDTVLVVILRGGGYGAEWGSNFNVVQSSNDADHYAFEQAALKVEKALDEYVKELKADEKLGIRGELKIWVSGYSRAAATANRVAHDINKNGAGGETIDKKNLYAYTFATPNVATRSNKYPAISGGSQLFQKDQNIYNIVSPQDIVPQVPLKGWDYFRYGNTYCLPVNNTVKLWDRYTDLSGKSVSGDNTPISTGQEDTVQKIRGAAESVVKTRTTYKDLLQEKLCELGSEVLGGKPDKNSDDAYEKLLNGPYEEVCKATGIPHVFSLLVKSNIVNIGRAHEPEFYYARLDTMEITEMEEMRYVTKLKIDNVDSAPNRRMIKLNEAAIRNGSCFDITDSSIMIYLYGESAEVDFTPEESGEANISITQMNDDGQEERTISYGTVGVAAGKKYSFGYSEGSLDTFTFTDSDQVSYPAAYDSAKTDSAQTHSITVEGGAADLEKAYPGQPVTIYATGEDETLCFESWEVSGGHNDKLSDSADSITTFFMPDEDVTITANYAENEYWIDTTPLWSDKKFDPFVVQVYKGYDAEKPLSSQKYTLSYAEWTEDEKDAKFSDKMPSMAPGLYYVKAEIKDTDLTTIGSFEIMDEHNLENYTFSGEDVYWDDDAPEELYLVREVDGKTEELRSSSYKVLYASYDDYEKNGESIKGLAATSKIPSSSGDYVAVAVAADKNYYGSLMTTFFIMDSKDISNYVLRNSIYIAGAQTGLSLWRERNGEYEKLAPSAYEAVYIDTENETRVKGFPTEAGSYRVEFSGKGSYKGEKIEEFSLYERPDSSMIEDWATGQSEQEIAFANAGEYKYVKLQVKETGYYMVEAESAPSEAYTFVSVETILDENMENADMTGYQYARLEKGRTYYVVLYGGSEVADGFNATLKLKKCAHNTTMRIRGEKKSTCIRDGYTGNKLCDECDGIVEQGKKISKMGHTFGQWKLVSRATVNKAGTEQRSCSVCKTVVSRSVKKLTPTMKTNANSLVLKKNQSTKKFQISGLAEGDSVKSWTSTNKKIVTVSGKANGTCKIKGKKTGKAYIKVVLNSGLTKKIRVKVQKKTVTTTSIKNLPKKVTVKKGKSYTLKPDIYPITSTSKTSYKSAKKSIATASKKGVIKGKKKGKTKITVISGKKKKTVVVDVK